MTKLSKALGDKYQSKRANIFIRSFELGGHIFRVRIPFVAEADKIYQKVNNPDDKHIERIYKTLSEPLLLLKKDATDEIQYLENDVIVQGRSMREAAKNKAITENRIVEYIKLLIPEQPDMSLDDLTYEEVEAEFPFSVQLALVEKISEAISPGYKETRGN